MSAALSRRNLIKVGSGVAAGAALVAEMAEARDGASGASSGEMVARKWYSLWTAGSRDWASFDALLADDFTFTATSGEDHINKTAFKHECWENQIGHIKGFDLTLLVAKGDDVFVKYLCHTVGGQSFRNIELHRVRDGRLLSVECYFGANAGYPTAADSKKS
jgi:ketosteroid isomerase-like protein